MRVPVVRSHLVGLGLVFLCSMAAALPASAEELKRVSERLLPFAPGGEIHIDDKNGQLVVDAWPRHDVRIQITRVVRTGDRAKAEALMKELQSEVEVKGDRIDIRSRFPRRAESIGMNVGARTTNGDVQVSDVKGSVTLQTTNGEVHVTNVTGQASGHTTNGTVVAEIRRLPGSGHVDLQSTNGNVVAYFDSDVKADLDASTTNGRVSIDFPVTVDGMHSARTIQGTIAGGGAKISLTTTNGNVEVRRLGGRR